jgi:hypothetical protein
MPKLETSNCEACGVEYFTHELHNVRLAGWKTKLKICASCQNKSSAESFETAASILKNIEKLASSTLSAEERLAQIINLVNGDN